jgi:hypothetical protein
VACPYDCGDSFQRRQLHGHKVDDCPNRNFTCQYCDHRATYIKVTNEHWPICKQYPLECPNKCGANAIKWYRLSKHLENICPLVENWRVHLLQISHAIDRNLEQALNLTRVALDAQNPLAPVFVPPPNLVKNFQRHKEVDDLWYSPPFHSHSGVTDGVVGCGMSTLALPGPCQHSAELWKREVY